MKKIKWILLIIAIFFIVVLILGSCKKTKAHENGINYGQNVYIDVANNNLGTNLVLIQNPRINNTSDQTHLWISDYGGANYLLCTCYTNSGGGFIVNFSYGGNTIFVTTPIPYIDVLGVVTNIGTYPQTGNNIESLCYAWSIYYVSHSGNTAQIDVANYYWYPTREQGAATDYSSFINSYESVNGLKILYLYDAGNYNYRGLYNAFALDVYDYSQPADSWTEFVDYINEDIVSLDEIKDYSSQYLAGYGEGERQGYDDGYAAGSSAGYSAGYNAGYSAGYSAGETYGYGVGRTDGYNEGYSDGLADNAAGQTTAYNQGYDAGYADGYRYGQSAGFEEGFSTGYDRGLAEGMAGATPMSQATTLIGSIFTGIGSILSIQLFPGFPLGLLILVPLFFSVLGLILWIWRRN